MRSVAEKDRNYGELMTLYDQARGLFNASGEAPKDHWLSETVDKTEAYYRLGKANDDTSTYAHLQVRLPVLLERYNECVNDINSFFDYVDVSVVPGDDRPDGVDIISRGPRSRFFDFLPTYGDARSFGTMYGRQRIIGEWASDYCLNTELLPNLVIGPEDLRWVDRLDYDLTHLTFYEPTTKVHFGDFCVGLLTYDDQDLTLRTGVQIRPEEHVDNLAEMFANDLRDKFIPSPNSPLARRIHLLIDGAAEDMH